MQKVELLAPAGSMESIYAAIKSGADAIYMGGSKFSARAYATNFDNEELIKAVDYIHLNEKKVYITLNTLIKQCELKEVIEYIGFLYEIGVDALITQDLSIPYIVKDRFKDFEIHASTQMTIHNGDGAICLKDLGFKRIVLSRELSLEEIKYISDTLDIETEVFIHGALCICYSGQCLMSSIIGGRSGNRGRCAQPCRMPYTLINKDTKEEKSAFLLSPKDMCTLEDLEDIINTKTSSLKIEGRMKRPEYVAGVVETYKNAIDDILKNKEKGNLEKEKKKLLQLFNREGFSKAYLYGNKGKDMMSYNYPKNTGISIGIVDKEGYITLKENINLKDGIRYDDKGFTISKIILKDKEVLGAKIGEKVMLYPSEYKKSTELFKTLDIELMKGYEKYYKEKTNISIKAKVIFEIGKPFSLEITYKDKVQTLQGAIVEKAKNRPLTKEKIVENLQKSSDNVLKISDIKFEAYEEGFIPISAINEIRRNILRELEEEIIKGYRRDKVAENNYILKEKKIEQAPEIMVGVNTLMQLKAAMDSNVKDIIINPYFRGIKCITSIDFSKIAKDTKVYIEIPTIVRKEFNSIVSFIENNKENIAGIVTSNLGIINRFKNSVNIIGSYKLNLYNNLALNVMDEFTNLNCISIELNRKEIKEVLKKKRNNCQVFVYGKPELMVSEYCPIGSVNKCGLLGNISSNNKPKCLEGEYVLRDRKNMDFLVKTDKFCRSHIYNTVPINLIDKIEELKGFGADSFRLDFIDEDYEKVISVLSTLKNKELLEGMADYTRGHYKRGVD
ncbi:U32 family peptidase [Clostridium algidicarnis]|uniref:U32 family peptidase n=1 Tax=Clostridium algidicarnis TaxID=37659 RepID=UPI001CF49EF7|nr:U32 family peptidase [Clostridium algidicarnis]MCB2285810.1 U32 family peptidase [Clostridium algidicarnis]